MFCIIKLHVPHFIYNTVLNLIDSLKPVKNSNADMYEFRLPLKEVLALIGVNYHKCKILNGAAYDNHVIPDPIH